MSETRALLISRAWVIDQRIHARAPEAANTDGGDGGAGGGAWHGTLIEHGSGLFRDSLGTTVPDGGIPFRKCAQKSTRWLLELLAVTSGDIQITSSD